MQTTEPIPISSEAKMEVRLEQHTIPTKIAIVQLVIPLHAATKQKDEQILDVLQEEEEEDDSEDTAGDDDDENQIESQLIEADKKAPIAISGITVTQR